MCHPQGCLTIRGQCQKGEYQGPQSLWKKPAAFLSQDSANARQIWLERWFFVFPQLQHTSFYFYCMFLFIPHTRLWRLFVVGRCNQVLERMTTYVVWFCQPLQNEQQRDSICCGAFFLFYKLWSMESFLRLLFFFIAFSHDVCTHMGENTGSTLSGIFGIFVENAKLKFALGEGNQIGAW